MGDRPDRPLFCGNYEYDAEEREIVRLFQRFGKVEKIDMKTGFSFVYMADRRDAEDAIAELHDREFGYKRRRLKVQWAKMAEADRKRETRPCPCLFVVNFDVGRVRERDLEKYFDYYGKLARVEIRKNFAFVQFEEVRDAERALEACNGRQFMGRTISVEFVANDRFAGRDGSRGGGRSPSPRRRRSPSPVRRRRDSRSPPPRRRGSPTPPPRRRGSPSPVRRRGSPSPPPRRRSPSPARRRSPSPRNGRSRSRSPVRRDSLSPARKDSRSPARGDSRSPPPRRDSRSPPPRSPIEDRD